MAVGYKDREDRIDEAQAERFNPTSQISSAEDETGKNAGVNAGIDQAEAFANDPGNTNKNTESANQQEQSPPSGNWKNSVSNDKTASQSKRKINVRKAAPAGGVVTLLLGGVFGIGVLLAPALGLVHLKEVFTEDLNDQVGALDESSTHMFRAKLKGIGKKFSVCKGVKIRCGLQGMSDRQIKNFEKAGIKVNLVEPESKGPTGKNAVKNLEFTDGRGGVQTVSNANDVKKLGIDRTIGKQLKRAYNPLFYSMWDKTAGKVFANHGGKAKRLKGTTAADFNKSVDDAASGKQAADFEADQRAVDDEDDTKKADDDRERNKNAQEQNQRLEKSSGFKSVFGGAAKGVGVTGAIDSACTVYNVSRAVEAAGKIYAAKQLIDFALVYTNTIDELKAGTASPEQIEYIGNSLTKVDTREMIVNENSADLDTPVKNPNFGKSGFDSEGARVSFYNEAPDLSAEAQQFLVGGAAVGTLSKINDRVAEMLGGGSRQELNDKCGLVQNPFVRGGSLVIGGIAAVGSFGLFTAVSVGASVAISAAIPLLEGYLKDKVKQDVVDSDTQGVDAVNAIQPGTGALMGEIAMSRGMQPANKATLRTYQAMQSQTHRELAAIGIEDARSTPFDVMNQYSFMGMFARDMLPVMQTTASASSFFTNGIPKLVGSIGTPFTSKVNAASEFNPERFSKCNDSGYKELDIDADIFCNVRYMLTPQELAMIPEDVYQWMADNDQVDADSGETTSGSDYEQFIEECTARTIDGTGAGWGDIATEGESDGSNCIDGKSDFSNTQLKNFRMYTLYRSVEEGMDNGPDVGEESASTSTNGSDFKIQTFNILYSTAPGPDYVKRLENSIAVIKDRGSDIVGFQEVRENQWNGIKKAMNINDSEDSSDFGIFPKKYGSQYGDTNPIIWNTKKFNIVGSGTYIPGHRVKAEDNGGATVPGAYTQVKLRDVTTGQEIYVINVHMSAGGEQINKQARYNDSIALRDYMEKISGEGTPVFITGDFNSGYKRIKNQGVLDGKVSNLTYCIFTENGSMWDGYDARDDKEGECPSETVSLDGGHDPSPVDHIFMSKVATVSNIVRNKPASKGGNNGSDVHDTIIQSVSIPGSGSDESGLIGGDGWTWPVPGVKSLGILPYGSPGSRGIHKGIDIGISGGAALGRPVVAAHGGTVERVWGQGESCGAYISIKAEGTKYYAAYQHVDGSSIAVKAGDTVQKGQPIARIGRQGGTPAPVGCGSSLFYHLHFSIESNPGSVSAYADPFPNGTLDPLKVIDK